MSATKKTYYKHGDGFFLNTWYEDGAAIELFPRQAQYSVLPLGNELRETKTAPKKAPAKAPAKAGD